MVSRWKLHLHSLLEGFSYFYIFIYTYGSGRALETTVRLKSSELYILISILCCFELNLDLVFFALVEV